METMVRPPAPVVVLCKPPPDSSGCSSNSLYWHIFVPFLELFTFHFKKTQIGDSLRFVLFVSVLTDSLPPYDDVNHFFEGSYISVKELEQENHSCSISGKLTISCLSK